MVSAAAPSAGARPRASSGDVDNRVVLHGISWDALEQLLAARGERSGVRITYLEGELELMSPSNDHETIKKTLGRLVEAYADELGLELNGIGSWTISKRRAERAVEPDECYVLGPWRDREEPDLAIEVVWTRGGLDKLEVYRGLGVREVWVWEDGAMRVFVLRGEAYETRDESELLPSLDLALVARLATADSQPAAVRELRAAMRRG